MGLTLTRPSQKEVKKRVIDGLLGMGKRLLVSMARAMVGRNETHSTFMLSLRV